MILVIKFILAFCSIAYELVLAQSLTAFLENTVLRYAVTIGLYLFSMGLGAFFVAYRRPEALRGLWKTEVLLTLIGAGSLPLLFMVDHFFPSRIVFLIVAHGLVILIGFLTGFELPFLLEISQARKAASRSFVMAADYAGAFAGTLAFAFLFYPRLGLISAALWIAFLNSVAGWQILRFSAGLSRVKYVLQILLMVSVMAAIISSSRIEGILVNRFYLG